MKFLLQCAKPPEHRFSKHVQKQTFTKTWLSWVKNGLKRQRAIKLSRLSLGGQETDRQVSEAQISMVTFCWWKIANM